MKPLIVRDSSSKMFTSNRIELSAMLRIYPNKAEAKSLELFDGQCSWQSVVGVMVGSQEVVMEDSQLSFGLSHDFGRVPEDVL